MSTWDNFKKKVVYPSLKGDVEAEVVIIGGGMAGVLCAYQLARSGWKVVLLEKKEVGSGATLATTAFITEVIDTPYSQISSIFSPGIARAVHESKERAIEELENIIEEEEIDCEFTRCPNYLYAATARQFQELKDEFKIYRRYKWPMTFHETSLELGFPHHGVLETPNQAKFHPAKFLFALAKSTSEHGAQIFENSEVIDLEGEAGDFLITTRRGSIQAKNVVIATYKPFTNQKTHLKKAMYKSYVFEVEVPKGAFPEALYEDCSNPYYYFRIDPGKNHDRMIVGGEDHKDIFGKTLNKKSFESLAEFVDKLMDSNEPGGRSKRYWIVDKWSGPILEPTDGLPLIGEIAPGLYVASAFSGNGMTYSMISALLIRDLIEGNKNDWVRAYDPQRSILNPKRLGSKAKDFIEEFIQGALKNLLS
jgi:glycine/D-amino acid oxidase-like deaminating enzyme